MALEQAGRRSGNGFTPGLPFCRQGLIIMQVAMDIEVNHVFLLLEENVELWGVWPERTRKADFRNGNRKDKFFCHSISIFQTRLHGIKSFCDL